MLSIRTPRVRRVGAEATMGRTTATRAAPRVATRATASAQSRHSSVGLPLGGERDADRVEAGSLEVASLLLRSQEPVYHGLLFRASSAGAGTRERSFSSAPVPTVNENVCDEPNG